MENIKLEEGLIDKIKQILKNKKSDTQAIQDISDIIDFAPVIWGDNDDKPKKQGQKIRVDEAKEDKEKCVLCGKEIEGYGNNPAPLADEGKCCDSCNSKRVIPARLKAMKVNKMDEDVESEKIIKILAFDHDDPETLYLVSNLKNEQKIEIEERFEYVEDISDLKGLWIIGNSDDSFHYIDGSNYSSVEEWDKAVYNYFHEDADKYPDEQYVFGDEEENFVIDKNDIDTEEAKHFVSNTVKNSYVDGDSGYQYFFVNFTDTGAEPVDNYNSPYIYNNYEDFISELDESLQECDQFEYDDDYMIDYEDESEEEMEYDDDYSFRR